MGGYAGGNISPLPPMEGKEPVAPEGYRLVKVRKSFKRYNLSNRNKYPNGDASHRSSDDLSVGTCMAAVAVMGMMGGD